MRLYPICRGPPFGIRRQYLTLLTEVPLEWDSQRLHVREHELDSFRSVEEVKNKRCGENT